MKYQSLKDADYLACPIDKTPLAWDGNTFKCQKGHCFDPAKQGYLHLLPVQNKRSLDPGDSKEMVAARRAYLSAGHYDYILQSLFDVVASLSLNASDTVLDLGCGEGYYLSNLQARFGCHAVGLDISKWAVLAAAKQNKSCAWLVGTNANLPIQADSVKVGLCMFGFAVFSEFARVLQEDGYLVMLDPAEDHLIELRQIIYPEVKKHDLPSIDASKYVGFELTNTHYFRHKIVLASQNAIQQLLIMTPHLYKAGREGLEKAQKLASLELTLHFAVRVLKKTSG